MGIQIYIGAFIVFETKELVEESKERVCIKHKNLRVKDSDSKFCNLCGSKLSYKSPELRKIRWYEILPENFNHFLHWIKDEEDESINKFFIISNRYNKAYPDRIEHDMPHEIYVEIDSEMQNKFIQNFKKNHNRIISFLKDRSDKMEIKFGVVTDYS